MANNNNFTVGSAGNGNIFNVVQHQEPKASYVEYDVAHDSIEHLSRSHVHGRAFLFFASFVLPILGLLADGLGVLTFLGIQSKWAFTVLVSAAIVGTFLTNTKRKIATAGLERNRAIYIDGSWVEREDGGGYLLYRRTAKCIYPKCSGTVFIRPAPPREKPNHTLVGVCDLGNHRHTYTVDFNGIGFPLQFDWRPIEEHKP